MLCILIRKSAELLQKIRKKGASKAPFLAPSGVFAWLKAIGLIFAQTYPSILSAVSFFSCGLLGGRLLRAEGRDGLRGAHGAGGLGGSDHGGADEGGHGEHLRVLRLRVSEWEGGRGRNRRWVWV